MEKTKNEKLISIYRNFSKQCVTIAHELIYDESSLTTIRYKDDYKDLFNKLKTYFEDVDFKSFNTNQLKELGFQSWDDNLILAPTWIIDVCKDGTTFTTINDEVVIKGERKLSMDTRFGATSYGILISELRDDKLSSILI